MTKAQLAVTLYMQTQFLTGFIYHPCEERLSDLLNGVGQPESRGRFLALSDVTIEYADGKKERLSSAYINKATIELATGGDSSRGIGAKAGHKPYPFVEKSPLPVRLRLPAYVLIGSMHCTSGQRAWHVMEEKRMFLPLTNVRIRPRTNGIWWTAPFAAVNTEQILSWQEEDSVNGDAQAPL